MTDRKILNPDEELNEETSGIHEGHDVHSIGPSDSSDSGSDLAGASVDELGSDKDSDRSGTGERLTAGEEPGIRVGNDIAPDRVVDADQAGLGSGLDEAEEAQLGTTDEEQLAKRAQRRGSIRT